MGMAHGTLHVIILLEQRGVIYLPMSLQYRPMEVKDNWCSLQQSQPEWCEATAKGVTFKTGSTSHWTPNYSLLRWHYLFYTSLLNLHLLSYKQCTWEQLQRECQAYYENI